MLTCQLSTSAADNAWASGDHVWLYVNRLVWLYVNESGGNINPSGARAHVYGGHAHGLWCACVYVWWLCAYILWSRVRNYWACPEMGWARSWWMTLYFWRLCLVSALAISRDWDDMSHYAGVLVRWVSQHLLVVIVFRRWSYSWLWCAYSSYCMAWPAVNVIMSAMPHIMVCTFVNMVSTLVNMVSMLVMCGLCEIWWRSSCHV